MSEFDVAYSELTECYYFILNGKKYDITEFVNKIHQQGRADAIDELKNKLYERARDKGVYASEYIAFIDCVFEQLKESKNDN